MTSFSYISYSVLFCPFPSIDWFLDRFFSNNRSVWGFSLLFLRGIRRISGVIYYKSSPCPDKSKISLLSSRISISMDFSILVLLLDKLFFWVDLYLSIELSVLVLFWELGTVFWMFVIYMFCWLCQSFFAEIVEVMASFTTLVFDFPFFQPCQYSLICQPCKYKWTMAFWYHPNAYLLF